MRNPGSAPAMGKGKMKKRERIRAPPGLAPAVKAELLNFSSIDQEN
jgi:hypothetical protein